MTEVEEYLQERISKLEGEIVRLKEIIVVFIDHADVVTEYVIKLTEDIDEQLDTPPQIPTPISITGIKPGDRPEGTPGS